jgi:hypothetical protein
MVAPSVLIGVGMVMSPYWAYSRAGRSAYALTDRRAILIEVDGSGDLVFTQAIRWRSGGRRAPGQVGFLAIADVKRVEDMVRVLAAKTAR